MCCSQFSIMQELLRQILQQHWESIEPSIRCGKRLDFELFRMPHRASPHSRLQQLLVNVPEAWNDRDGSNATECHQIRTGVRQR
jgi:hypothetical protein